MEVQVNVGQDGGELVQSEWKGIPYRAWTDGVQTWKPFRIPYNAKVNPEYEDKPMNWDLAAHVEAIGLTGWNWVKRQSIWVAYDFDAISAHKGSGHTPEELQAVQNAALQIPWVSVYRSTSGSGYHLYVNVNHVRTENHTEHAALARAILARMSLEVNFDFNAAVDICGGNMWIWHRRMNPDIGFELIRQGVELEDAPAHWRDHIRVVSGTRKRAVPGAARNNEDAFEQLCSQRVSQSRDDMHKQHIKWLQENGYYAEWNSDLHLLVTHTASLKRLHETFNLRGIFETIAIGRDANDYNCFAFPTRDGGWDVRRFSIGCAEANTWEPDAAGWTRCAFNRSPDLKIAARVHSGVEAPEKEEYFFDKADSAENAANLLGANISKTEFQHISDLARFPAKLKRHKDGRLIFYLQAPEGLKLKDWYFKGGWWSKIFNIQTTYADEPMDNKDYDDLIRHVVSPNDEDAGWVLKSDNIWRDEPVTNVKAALRALGEKNVDTIIGACVWAPWKLVNVPFEREYLPERKWNRNAAQLKYQPSQHDDLRYPTWTKILNHIGEDLNEVIREHDWCRSNGIITGADYLKLWIASMFQRPFTPLPYLFLHGPQNSGKSIFHESLDLLVRGGIARAELALTNQNAFNDEIRSAVLCVVEELSLKTNKTAYSRIKDWVTARKISVHKKFDTPYLIPNTTHWVQCSNHQDDVPVFEGDTRITMIYVGQLDPMEMVPKDDLIAQLKREAADFTAAVLNLELPKSNDRLGIPIIETQGKTDVIQGNMNAVQEFQHAVCRYVPGELTTLNDAWEKFLEWAPAEDAGKWTKRTFWKELDRSRFPKGRSTRLSNQVAIGNLTFDPDKPASGTPFKLRGDTLVQ